MYASARMTRERHGGFLVAGETGSYVIRRRRDPDREFR
jgi:ribosomal protein L34